MTVIAGKPSTHPATDNPFDYAPMRTRQILVLITAVLLAALDGYDALSMAFVAPALVRDWGIDKTTVGLLLSSSLAGMALGAVALSPLADKLGRRTVVLGALVILIVGTAVSAIAASVPVLAASRVLTGVGIGVMVAMTTLIAAEFTSIRRRSLAIAGVATIGFPMGGVIGGFGAAAILKNASWPWVFGAGSIAGAVLFVLVALTLPESPAYLIARRAPGALERVNRTLARFGQAAMSEFPLATDARDKRYGALFEPGLRAIVARLAAVAILIATSSYYILNWLPLMVVEAGFTPAQGSQVSAMSGLIGFLGGIVFASFASRFPPTRVAGTAMTGAALSLAAVGLVSPSIPLFVASAGILGFCLAGTTGMLYSILADTFPAPLRASGTGLVMGMARIASAAGPAIAGVMFAQGMTRASVSLIFAVGPLIAAVLMITFRHRSVSAARR